MILLRNVVFSLIILTGWVDFMPTCTPLFGQGLSPQRNIFQELRNIDGQIKAYIQQNKELYRINKELGNLRGQLAEILQQQSNSFQNLRLQGLNYVLMTAIAWDNEKQIKKTQKQIIAEQEKLNKQITQKTQSLRNRIEQLEHEQKRIMYDTPAIRALLKRKNTLLNQFRSYSQESA